MGWDDMEWDWDENSKIGFWRTGSITLTASPDGVFSYTGTGTLSDNAMDYVIISFQEAIALLYDDLPDTITISFGPGITGLTNEYKERFASYAEAAGFRYEFSSVSNPAPVIKTVGGFTDVKPGDYFADPVLWAVEKKITAGTSDTTFSPNTDCTVAQILTFLWRANGSPKASGSNPFSDVKDGDYYYGAALWAYEKGMVSGETFGGDRPCTRSMAVTYMWKAAGGVNAAFHIVDGEVLAYYGSSNNAIVPDDVLWLDLEVFLGHPELTSVTIPSSVMRIDNAFHWVQADGINLTDIYYCGSEAEWDDTYWDTWGPQPNLTIHYNSSIPTQSNQSVKTVFTDVPANADYASAVAWAVEKGVTSGTSATTFSPDSVCTRGQIVTFLYRGLRDK